MTADSNGESQPITSTNTNITQPNEVVKFSDMESDNVAVADPKVKIDVIDLTDDNELSKKVEGMHGVLRYKTIQQYLGCTIRTTNNI